MNKYTLHNFLLFEFTIQLKTMRDGVETGECFDCHNNNTKRVFTLQEPTPNVCVCRAYSVHAKDYVHRAYVYNNSRSASAIRACLHVNARIIRRSAQEE